MDEVVVTLFVVFFWFLFSLESRDGKKVGKSGNWMD